jgi:hypothetical protein
LLSSILAPCASRQLGLAVGDEWQPVHYVRPPSHLPRSDLGDVAAIASMLVHRASTYPRAYFELRVTNEMIAGRFSRPFQHLVFDCTCKPHPRHSRHVGQQRAKTRQGLRSAAMDVDVDSSAQGSLGGMSGASSRAQLVNTANVANTPSTTSC